MDYKLANRMDNVKPSAIRELLKFASDPKVISFGGGFPDPDIFPLDKLEGVFATVISKYGKSALQYTSSEGILPLREKLVVRMKTAGINCAVDNLIIIQGGQQGLDFMAKAFINKGDVIIVERPTFLGALIAFNPYEPQYKCVGTDDDGMDMNELEQILKTTKNVKFIYTVPEFQNPTGKTMPLERRKRLIELANKYDVMILEDSPYREIRFEGDAIPPIKSFDTENRVVYLGSFSKILCPGIRLGWLIADRSLAARFTQLKAAADTQNSTVNMYAVNTFMETYDIDAHIKVIRNAYREKRDIMLGAIEEYFPKSVSYTTPEGGLFTWLTLPEGQNAAIIMVERLLPEANVAYVPGDGFFPVEPETNHARVNYSCMSGDKIKFGIKRMGEIFYDCFS